MAKIKRVEVNYRPNLANIRPGQAVIVNDGDSPLDGQDVVIQDVQKDHLETSGGRLTFDQVNNWSNKWWSKG